MAVIRARQNKVVSLKGSFGLPVVISHTLPEDPEPIEVEFATPYEEIPFQVAEFSFQTSNGTFAGNVIHWAGYEKYNAAMQHLTAVYDIIPVFRNLPLFKATVVVDDFKASSERVLASNDEFNIDEL